MFTIDKIDFTKLKPYDGQSTKCFEHLCYQLAQNEFGHLGTFTTIDGSGGDGGVEFYLKLSNGEKWGWQCKFFGDTGRLNVASRSKSIENSFETAIKNHSDLTKYFLCLKTDLTPDISSKKGELNWFKNELPKKIPYNRKITLEHWGESKFLTMFKNQKHSGIRSFFFGELEFNQEWFETKFIENFAKVRDKYDPELHSIDKFTQSKVDFLLFDTNYTKLTKNLKKELFDKAEQIKKQLSDCQKTLITNLTEKTQLEKFCLECHGFQEHIDFIFQKIDFIESIFINYKPELIDKDTIEVLNKNFLENDKKIDYSVFDKKSLIFEEMSNIVNLIYEFRDIYNRFFRNYFHDTYKELHFISDAAKGKTHISCDIVCKCIKNSKPAIFITGDKFTDETNILDALKKILDIPNEFTCDEFLQALDVYGSILNIRIPIIIDALNETTHNRLFSQIWKNHLIEFISKILHTKNLVIVTTCRKSYTNRIWDDTSNSKFHYLDGFEDYDTIKEAANKYFKKYKLKADLSFASLENFKDPIFLKIFCEIKNPNWKSSGEIEINIEEESTYDIFNEYLNQINKRVTNTSHLLKPNEPFITQTLSKLSNYLWENNLREIPIEPFYNLVDTVKSYEKDKSKADILINEGLVITRDMRNDLEYASFTYDMLAGFMIAKNLIDTNSNINYFTSRKFIKKILYAKGQHPLSEDIIYALCFLLPQIKQVKFHELLERNILLKFTETKFFKHLPKFITNKFANLITFSKHIFNQSIISIFKFPATVVKKEDIALIVKLFFNSNTNKKTFFNLFFKKLSNINHPLNAVLFSKLLASIKMNERDISWTEYIREKHYYIEEFIVEFKTQCRNLNSESEILINKQHLLSKIVVWFLTSTNRNLRDTATKALYYYGRKFPKEFISLVYDSLKFNDPYVWERTLAALYGVAMAEHNSLKSDAFRKNILPEIVVNIYNLIFKKDAPHSTTHILARDYARRTIEIGLLYHPHLLSEQEIKYIRPPYIFGGIRELGEYNYGEKEFDYAGPIHMDFSNYTIGRIVEKGYSYSDPPEKIKVRKQIYWRIFNLGWDAKLFKEAEKSIQNDNVYVGRSQKPTVERYGKKYSWIAYFENAGLRYDLGLLKEDWDDFRISSADIDPSFPENIKNEDFIKQDLLGDRTKTLVDWYVNGGIPSIEKYLFVKEINTNIKNWICLDSFINQQDLSTNRSCFAFIRGFIFKEADYTEIIKLLEKQALGERWLPEKHENYYTYAGELYYCKEATHDNYTSLKFEVEKKKVKIKKGEAGDIPAFIVDDNDNFSKKFPDEIEKEISITKDFDVLMPVMEYNWESYHSITNTAGHITVLGKEIANYLQLLNKPQTFDLFDSLDDIAAINIDYELDYNNNHTFIYIRKDLLDKFLTEKKLKFVWAIWGEREIAFQTDDEIKDFFNTLPNRSPKVFQKIIEYKST